MKKTSLLLLALFSLSLSLMAQQPATRLAYFGPIEEARAFFGKEKMEEIVKSINREEEGGDGRADEFILKYAEVQHV